jgi:hypothetical protein
MGQQQLLLLVLSTVIVGLATVAGIQAFSENQEQASQDALVQRGTSIASDVKGAAAKPTQLGGVDLSTDPDPSTIANSLGYSGSVVDADGAGGNGRCEIKTPSSNTVNIDCASDNAPTNIRVQYDASTDKVSTDFSTDPDVGT